MFTAYCSGFSVHLHIASSKTTDDDTAGAVVWDVDLASRIGYHHYFGYCSGCCFDVCCLGNYCCISRAADCYGDDSQSSSCCSRTVAVDDRASDGFARVLL